MTTIESDAEKAQLAREILNLENIDAVRKLKQAYRHLPAKEDVLTSLSNLDKLITDIRCAYPLAGWKHLLFNRLEDCVVPFTNSVRNVLRDLRKTNTDAVLMSGSGSTVFALVETEKDAKDLVNKLQNEERIVFSTTFHRSLKDENNGNKDTSYGGGSPKSVRQCNV